MTQEEAKMRAELYSALAEGKIIQLKRPNGTWKDVRIDELSKICNSDNYRIKPESRYRPFKDKEECWQEMQKHHPFGWVKRNGYYYNIIAIGVISVTIIGTEGNITRLNYSDLLSRYSFVDGTPFGVKEDE